MILLSGLRQRKLWCSVFLVSRNREGTEMDATTCQISPISGTCATHGGEDCNMRPLPRSTVTPREPRTQLYDLPIFGWAWREDGRDLRA